MIFSTFLIVILSILFGMYLGFKSARGEDIYKDMTKLTSKIKKFLRKIIN